MTTPELTDAREQSQLHLDIVEEVIETIRDTFPAAATLDCHQQMRDILTRIKNLLHHPILFAAHIIVYLVKAVRFSRRWATLVKNIASLDPLLLNRRSSDPSSPSSVLSPQHSVLSSPSPSPALAPSPHPSHSSHSSHPSHPSHSSHPSDPSDPSISSIPSIPSTPCASSHSSSFILPPSSFHHSIETRLRIRAFAQACQHERHIAEKLPPSVPKPDLSPILPSHRQPSALSPQPSALSSQSSLSPRPLPRELGDPLFPSEAFWESKVRSLQLKILGNITRIFPNICRAYLKQYNASISSTSSTPSPSSHSSSSSPSSHSSHSSHSSLPSSSSDLKPQVSGLNSHPPSALSSRHSPLSSHPPPQQPWQT